MRKINLFSLIILLFNIQVYAAEEISEASQQLLDELSIEIQKTVETVIAIEKSAGRTPEQFKYFIDFPADEYASMGILFEPESDNSGFRVVSVTPGSQAEKLAIQSGYKLIGLNGKTIDPSNIDAFTEMLRQVSIQTQLNMLFETKQGTLAVNYLVDKTFSPRIRLEIGELTDRKQPLAPIGVVDESRACGEVSVFYHPPFSKNLYRAKLISIVGENINISTRYKQTYKLPPGKYTVKMRELISVWGNEQLLHSPYLSAELQKANVPVISSPPTRIQRKDRYAVKSFEIEVKANTRLDLAAKKNGNQYRPSKPDYWTPEVWRVEELACEL